jgi:peptidoglycan hydrolase-like protein with peptidoglycan-binding domain
MRTSFIVAIVCAALLAKPCMAESFAGWDVEPYPAEGADVGCIAVSPPQDGRVLSIQVDPKFRWEVHIANPAWRIGEDASTPMTLSVDGQQLISGTAQSDGKGELVIRASSADQYHNLEHGDSLLVETSMGSLHFDLAGSGLALAALFQCIKDENRNREQSASSGTQPSQSTQERSETGVLGHIQELLIWTGFYNGFVDGRSGSETDKAIRDFQRSIGHPATGDLNTDETRILEERGSERKVAAGYRAIVDDNIGIRLGIPYGLVPPGSRTESGTNWHSRDDRVQIDTFAKPNPIHEIYSNLCCNQSMNPGRITTYKPFNSRWFVVTGTDTSRSGRTEFYTMAADLDGRTVGFAIKYDESMASDLRPVGLSMASDFVADPRVQRIFWPDRLVNPKLGTPNPPSIPNPQAEIPFEESPSGILQLPVRINNVIVLEFAVDSGAANVTIPKDVVETLVRTGTITNDDLLNEQRCTLADGSSIPCKRFRIKSLQIGDKIVQDIEGNVVPENGILLLGQSFFKRFKSWSIDNERKVLRLSN